MVTRRGTNTGLVMLAALAMVAVMPGAVGVASADDVPAYKTADGATRIKGATTTLDAPPLKPGLYADSIGRGQRKIYTVRLDARSSAYFSVVAAPKPGTKVEEYKDKLTVRVQDTSSNPCSTETSPTFHAGETPYPIGDYASRNVGRGETACKDAGPYYVVVSREGSATSGPDAWPIELSYTDEPPLKGRTPAAPVDGSWSTKPPEPRTDSTKRRARGGTGFNDAGSVGTGVWTDRIRPGETRFYRVPVSWGQRLNLRAELPNAPSSASGTFLSNALGLNVFNPARGVVDDDNFVYYNGEGATAKEFTAPVDYGNRFNTTSAVKAMRFAGWYYLEVTLNAGAAKFFPKGTGLTLRVDVKGEAKAGPAYSEPADQFTVTDEEREMARKGQTEQAAEKSGTLRTVAYAGIGTGVVLLLGLGVWTLVARRRAAGTPRTPGTPQTFPQRAQQPSQPQFPQQGSPDSRNQQPGPPQGW
ncbi:hypothetical protein [Streptomyces sp. NPDC053427]|uniref:hypothetical protein n=1 Tax=Streptomyces sp. NPDC053427 TaxID=3365701 RepID=UPI0037CEEF62